MVRLPRRIHDRAAPVEPLAIARGLEGIEGHPQFVHQGVVEGVEGLGAVQGDEAHLAAGLDDQIVISHGVSSSLVVHP